MAMLIEPAGIIAPIEISISPAIIRSPTGIATIPRLAAKLTQLAAPKRVPRFTPPKITKKAITPTRLRTAPASGRRRKAENACMASPSLLLRGVAERHRPEAVVGQHGDEQQRADDDRSDVRIDAGEEDALVHNGEGDRAEDDADDGAAPAGQNHAPDHDAHDRIEYERLPGGDL